MKHLGPIERLVGAFGHGLTAHGFYTPSIRQYFTSICTSFNSTFRAPFDVCQSLLFFEEFKNIMIKKLSVTFLALMIGAVSVFAQDAQIRSLTSGQKYKIKGAVVSKDDDNTFIIRDTSGVDTRVFVAPEASVKTKGGFFGGSDRIASNQIVRGLYLEAEGRGDGSGNLA
ncbi:MAG: hypothetical protein LC734_10505, partial [Acidobacteria bacterium]|nr:hypothetical protein [Acidobacteriota bacterium]